MRAPSFPRVTLGLPDWVEEFVSDLDRTYPTEEDRMRLVIELSRLNVIHATGGPFGAGIFDLSTNRLLAPGVNLVTTSNLSIVHAEIVAIMVAQQVLGHFDLGSPGHPNCELVASTEPCVQCFDEGPKLPDWVGALEQRGISVVKDTCREEAAAVLRDYAESGGLIYNARRGD